MNRAFEQMVAALMLPGANGEILLEEVVQERLRQDQQWGGPRNDDMRLPTDWCDYIDKQLTQAGDACTENARKGEWRQRMVKIAALALAGIQSWDRLKAQDETPAVCQCDGCRFEAELMAAGLPGNVKVVKVESLADLPLELLSLFRAISR